MSDSIDGLWRGVEQLKLLHKIHFSDERGKLCAVEAAICVRVVAIKSLRDEMQSKLAQSQVQCVVAVM